MKWFRASGRKAEAVQGGCPDCAGKGYPTEALSDPIGFSSFDAPPCETCEGTGVRATELPSE